MQSHLVEEREREKRVQRNAFHHTKVRCSMSQHWKLAAYTQLLTVFYARPTYGLKCTKALNSSHAKKSLEETKREAEKKAAHRMKNTES